MSSFRIRLLPVITAVNDIDHSGGRHKQGNSGRKGDGEGIAMAPQSQQDDCR
jgi:hypothetical protein